MTYVLKVLKLETYAEFYTEYKYCFIFFSSTSLQAFLIRQEQENQKQIARDLQQRLEAIAKSQEAKEKPKPKTDLKMVNNTFGIMAADEIDVRE